MVSKKIKLPNRESSFAPFWNQLQPDPQNVNWDSLAQLSAWNSSANAWLLNHLYIVICYDIHEAGNYLVCQKYNYLQIYY